jgi:hypothetical protein
MVLSSTVGLCSHSSTALHDSHYKLYVICHLFHINDLFSPADTLADFSDTSIPQSSRAPMDVDPRDLFLSSENELSAVAAAVAFDNSDESTHSEDEITASAAAAAFDNSDDSANSDHEISAAAAAAAFDNSDESGTSNAATDDPFSDSEVDVPASMVAAEFEDSEASDGGHDDSDVSEGGLGGRILAGILGGQVQFGRHQSLSTSDSDDQEVTAADAADAFGDSDDDIAGMEGNAERLVGPFTAQHFANIPGYWIHPSGSDT